MIEGEPGLGRSRFLDVCVLEAKLFGATVLRAGAGEPGSSDYGVVKALGAQLLEAFPNLEPASGVAQAARRARGWNAGSTTPECATSFWSIPRSQHLVIAVDDFDRIDEPSQAILAALTHHCEIGR